MGGKERIGGQLGRFREEVADSALKLLYLPFGISRQRIRPRSSPEHIDRTINSLANFLEKAEFTVKISAGKMSPALYDHPRITETMEKLANRGVQIEIVYGPESEIYQETRRPFRLERLGGVRIHRLPDEVPPHFWLIDGKRIMDDTPREPEDPDRTLYLISESPYFARTLEREFAYLKRKALATAGK